MIFARDVLHLPVPKVHRTFTAAIPYAGNTIEGHFIVMDYIFGPTVETCWKSLDSESQLSIAQQVADMIGTMQCRPLDNHAPGPIGRGKNDKFRGPWFTDYGAGPFDTLRDLEDWFNHKVDDCIMVNQLPANAPRFCFRDIVLTHQDISERNIILDKANKVWLVDWGCAGVYPRGFEQAVLREQSTSEEFTDMVLGRLSDRQDEMAEHFSDIAYGLSTGRLL